MTTLFINTLLILSKNTKILLKKRKTCDIQLHCQNHLYNELARSIDTSCVLSKKYENLFYHFETKGTDTKVSECGEQVCVRVCVIV